jgi:hypothetical protein
VTDSFSAGCVDELVEVGKKHEITIQEIAFRWLVHHSQLSRKYGDGIITASHNVEHNKVALGIFCFFFFLRRWAMGHDE